MKVKITHQKLRCQQKMKHEQVR